MNTQTAVSTLPLAADAVADLRAQLGDEVPTLVAFFASSSYDAEAINQAMRDAFPASTVIGCTTAGEIGRGQMLKQSIVAMAFGAALVEQVALAVVRDLKRPGAIEEAAKSLEDQLGAPLASLAYDQYVGLVLIDGLSMGEEALMDRLGDMTNVCFVGGSAGDDLQFQRTTVFAEGEALSNAAVLVILKPKTPFAILKTQSFRVLEQRLVVTEVDAENREVISFNGRPAVEAYAEAVGCAPEAIADHFMRHPVGLIAGDEVFVRSPQRANGSHMVFYCAVLPGQELALLESTDIVEDTRRALDEQIRALGGASAIVNFHCILRTLELEKKQQCDAYGALFSKVPAIGFSTYGEAYLGHINQTSTMLVLK